jgi:predicted XRE-type DNA-binding protein
MSGQKGYLKIMFTANGNRMAVYAHRVVWMVLNHAEIPEGLEVNHKDGNKRNNHPDNLEVITREGNIRHSFDVLGHRTKEQRGEANTSARLTAEQIVQIRRFCTDKLMTQEQIAAMYGVTQRSVSDIHWRRTWKHIS